VHAQGDAHIDAAWNSTATRTARIAEYVAEMAPGATVLLVGLLPRGDVTLHPNPDAFKLPSKCAPSASICIMCSLDIDTLICSPALGQALECLTLREHHACRDDITGVLQLCHKCRRAHTKMIIAGSQEQSTG
jgi:hypothetical protein